MFVSGGKKQSCQRLRNGDFVLGSSELEKLELQGQGVAEGSGGI